jgi:peptidoglycan/LPS O-acetylase OafA/YrhL
VLALYGLTVSPVDWESLGWHWVMGHGFWREFRHAINVPMWTLPVECGFYLLAPWLFVTMRRVRARFEGDHTSARSWHWMHAVSLLVCSALLLGVGAALHAFAPNDFEWWKGTIFGRFSQFGLGVVTGLLLADIRAGVIRLPRAAGNGFTLAAIALFVVQARSLEHLDDSAGQTPLSWLHYGLKLSFSLTACLLILAAVCDSLWQRFLASRPLLYLGAISYALYLIQCASFGPVNILSEASARYFLGLGLNAWASAGVTMLICIAAAMVVHHGFESPVQHWLRRKLLRRSSG